MHGNLLLAGIMNMTEELNILDKHINYIAGYEAGTPFIDITTILNIGPGR